MKMASGQDWSASGKQKTSQDRRLLQGTVSSPFSFSRMSNDDEVVDALVERSHKRRKVDIASVVDRDIPVVEKKTDGATTTTNTTTLATDPYSSNNSNLSKKQRRRLKKLLKRAAQVDSSAQFSGITSDSDWEELKDLFLRRTSNDDQLPHVSIQWRSSKPKPVLDASTHRLFLMRLLQTVTGDISSSSSSKKKKRKHEEDSSTSTYACFSLHNPPLVNHVSVIQVHVANQTAMEQLCNRLLENQRTAAAVSSSTMWFQKDQPLQSISDALLYTQRNKVKATKADAATTTVSSMSDLIDKMEPLLLTPEQLQREGYPVIRRNKGGLPEMSYSSSWTSTRPQDIPLEQAHEYIRAYLVATPAPSCDDEQLLSPFVAPQQKKLSSTDRRVFALDCEMVQTCAGLELARVTLCQLKSFSNDDIETELIFDALVRPSNPILDYKTEYSGMTAAILNDKMNKDIVAIQQVQAALLATIHSNDIVIGHSLENDLRATRWIHDTVIDTSVLFRSARKRFKYSLRHLAAVLLKIQIQQRDKPHCSEEDAVTALKLAVGRVIKGASFCIYEKLSPVNILAELSTQKATVACMGTSDWLQRHVLSSSPNAVHALQCDSVSDYNAKAVSSWVSVNAVWANFRLKNQGDIDQLDKLLQDVARDLSPRGVFMVAIQPGYEKADQLTKVRAVRRKPRATIPWSDSEEEEWCQAVENCRQGVVYWFSGQCSPE